MWVKHLGQYLAHSMHFINDCSLFTTLTAACLSTRDSSSISFSTFSAHGSPSSPTTFFEWARKGKLSLFSVWPLGGAKDTALFKQGQEGRGMPEAPFPKGVARTVGTGRVRPGRPKGGVRAEVELPYLQEGLGPDPEMQLQTSAFLPVEWPKLTAQPETLGLWAFLGRTRKPEPGILPFENSNMRSAHGPRPHSQGDLPGSEAQRQGSGLELPVVAACGSGNPRDPAGRGKRPTVSCLVPSLQQLSQPARGPRTASSCSFIHSADHLRGHITKPGVKHGNEQGWVLGLQGKDV